MADCRLYQRKSEKTGATYFTGKMGFTRIALLKAREQPDDGSIVWNLVVQQAEQKQDDRPSAEAKAQSQASARGGFDKELDDEIPFMMEWR